MDYPHSTDPLVVQNALTNYQIAKENYKEALKTFNKYEHLKLTDPLRARALANLLAARQKMDTAFALYNWYLLPPSANDIAQANANLAAAQANLAQAQANYDNLKNGPSSSDLAIAEANLADAQRAIVIVRNILG